MPILSRSQPIDYDYFRSTAEFLASMRSSFAASGHDWYERRPRALLVDREPSLVQMQVYGDFFQVKSWSASNAVRREANSSTFSLQNAVAMARNRLGKLELAY